MLACIKAFVKPLDLRRAGIESQSAASSLKWLPKNREARKQQGQTQLAVMRKLGFWSVFCIASGAMISSGLFVLPGLAFTRAGAAIVLAYALAALMAVPAAISQAELASAMPRSGGSYFFIERSMGALPGTLAGLANWFSISLKSAFALLGIGAFTQLIWPDTDMWVIKAIAIGFCIGFTVLNTLSVKHTGWVQITLVVILLAILGFFAAAGMPRVQHAHFARFMDKGIGAVFATAGLVFVSFGGLTKVASIAGEVRRPGRNLPAGMFAALLVVSLLYVAAAFVTVGVLRAGQLYDPQTGYVNLTPLCTAAGEFLGQGGVILLAAAAMLAFVTTANSGILTASRSPMAMSGDRLLPGAFKTISRRFRTPYVSIAFTAAFMIAIISALSLEDLVKVASTMMLMLFLLSNLAVLIMRGSRIQNYRPLFRSPAFPWMQLAGIAMYLFLIVEMGRLPLLTTGAFALAGVLWYILYVRPRSTRESAFVYMVRSVLSKRMYRSNLEDELREIALERDEVIHDRFDRLVKNCAILDLPSATGAEEMFAQAARTLAGRIGIDERTLLKLFKAREAESSTVIQPGLAIPHIVVEGQNLFEILLVRCTDGMSFPNQPCPVHAAFVLIGSADERNYHLRALMAVAHIVQEPNFTRRWLEAPRAEHLRDIILLSKRDRGALEEVDS